MRESNIGKPSFVCISTGILLPKILAFSNHRFRMATPWGIGKAFLLWKVRLGAGNDEEMLIKMLKLCFLL